MTIATVAKHDSPTLNLLLWRQASTYHIVLPTVTVV